MQVTGKFVVLNRPDSVRIRSVSSALIALAASCGSVGLLLALGDSGVSFEQLGTAAKFYSMAVVPYALALHCYAGRVTVDTVSGFITFRGHRFMGGLRKNLEIFNLNDLKILGNFKHAVVLRFPQKLFWFNIHRFWIFPKLKSMPSTKNLMLMTSEPIPLKADLAARPNSFARVKTSNFLERFILSKDGVPASPSDEAQLLAFFRNPVKS
jgi:hypothetical protein